MIILILPIYIYSNISAYEKTERTANIYLLNENYEEAVAILKQYLKNNPTDFRIYKKLGDVYFNDKEYNKAEQLYITALEETPQHNLEIYYQLGLIHYKLSQYKKSSIYLLKILHACADVEKCLITYPKIYRSLGINYFLSRQYTRAIKYFKIHLTKNPKDTQIYSFTANAYKHLNRQNNYQVYFELHHLLINKPDISVDTFYYEKGLIFLKYKNPKDALMVFTKIYKQNKKNYKVNYNVGLAFLLIDDYEMAVQHLTKTVLQYNKTFSLSRLFKRLFHIDQAGAKYLLVLSLSTYLNNDKTQAEKIYNKIKSYNSAIYRKYRYDYIKGKNSTLYKECKDLWEY